ncbi:MAG: hypothetical protein ACR2QF_06210 [Geminicoccaceae bacterium]
MVDFTNVSDQKVSGSDTAVYELFDINMDDASLVVSPATRSNKPYNGDLIKLMVPQQRRISGGKVNAGFLDKYRKDLVPLYAKHILKNWAGVTDRTGSEVQFSQENAQSFLDALPAQSFDALVEFCENESNFRDTDTTELAKNSVPS